MLSNRCKKIIFAILIPIFWIGVWYLISLCVNSEFLMPTPHSTLFALFDLMKRSNFYKVVAYTLLRVIIGVVLGVIGGVCFAIVSYKFSLVRRLLSPLISIIKATPVVTFITLLWISMNGNTLTVFIAFLMVMPIVWQNLLNGFDSIPKELGEVCDVFEASPLKRMKILILPVLMSYFFPAVITSIGLAWKAEIATEIIAYTKVSIGQYIYDARYHLLTDEVFAWVVVIVAFSIALEALTKKLLMRFSK